MNFLAHLYLARGDDNLMLGAMLGDFVRGRLAAHRFSPELRVGIGLHRHIDRFTDHAAEVRQLRRQFPRGFRRYSGVIIDLAFDHLLARSWAHHADVPLEQFDREVRALLDNNAELLPPRLVRFMAYADARGLFAGYRSEQEMLFSLAGIGTRFRRANPLDRVGEIWPAMKPALAEGFEQFFPRLQSEVAEWRKRRSTMTGS
jgi:acyl carrier protein phosphodiesterase